MKEDDVKDRLNRSLSTIEQSEPTQKPTSAEMIQLIKRTRRKQSKEMFFFLLVALVIITNIVLLIASDPLLFVVFQTVVTVLGLGVLVMERRLQHE